MFVRQRLSTRGCIVLYHAVSDEMADELRSAALEVQDPRIPETWDGVHVDSERSRVFVPYGDAEVLSELFERHYRTFFSIASAVEWSYRKTSSGSSDQPPRREFSSLPGSTETLNVCSLPGTFLLALQDHTYVTGFGWNNQVALQSSQRLIELNKGDVLMHSGDFVFARAGSATNNICLHGYLDTPLYPRPAYQDPEIVPFINDTSVGVDDVFWNCTFKARDPQVLRKHLNRYHNFYFNILRASF
ncbi:hypothetical protein PHYSODRAFT_503775 [Phytophthora sojae]|uniref:Uncharacterized protein n=1 Tax=Phytophthora sojae (strain P6497) TaxID=1094619 RepID=G4ZEB1_PHYSP|nr:hypothetical protein PHYSODRAFT_503775 [Phytophthora sojae]EGZ17874.1 hypothetical protein PHYSODRAFT_503775 [Phytophthora sojae]|eukprot:XP_009526932.1 hypothetical protein PHYSODRAFT_503775 [Phytophthora sojae]